MTHRLIEKKAPLLHKRIKALSFDDNELVKVYKQLGLLSESSETSISADSVFWELAYFDVVSLGSHFVLEPSLSFHALDVCEVLECSFAALEEREGTPWVVSLYTTIKSKIGGLLLHQVLRGFPIVGYVLCRDSAEILAFAMKERIDLPLRVSLAADPRCRLPSVLSLDASTEFDEGRNGYEECRKLLYSVRSIVSISYLLFEMIVDDFELLDDLPARPLQILHERTFDIPHKAISGAKTRLGIVQARVKGVYYVPSRDRALSVCFWDLLFLASQCSDRDGDELLDAFQWLISLLKHLMLREGICRAQLQDVLVQSIKKGDNDVVFTLNALDGALLASSIPLASLNALMLSEGMSAPHGNEKAHPGPEGDVHLLRMGDILHPLELAVILGVQKTPQARLVHNSACFISDILTKKARTLSFSSPIAESTQSVCASGSLLSYDAEAHTDCVLSAIGLEKENVYDLLAHSIYNNANSKVFSKLIGLFKKINDDIFNFCPCGRAPLLHLAVRLNQPQFINRLLVAGANENITFRGLSPLLAAAKDLNIPMVTALVRSGADVNAVDAQTRDIMFYLRNIVIDQQEVREESTKVSGSPGHPSVVAARRKERFYMTSSQFSSLWKDLRKRGYRPHVVYKNRDTLLHALVRARAVYPLHLVTKEVEEWRKIENRSKETVLDLARRCPLLHALVDALYSI